MADFSYDIDENLGVISEGTRGWKKELNLISWSGNEPKYDIRDWSPDHEKMTKGVTLTKEDLVSLRDLLNSLDL